MEGTSSTSGSEWIPVQMDRESGGACPQIESKFHFYDRVRACNRRDETIDAGADQCLGDRLQCAITNRETSNAAGTPPSPQSVHPKRGNTQYQEHCGRQRHDVVDGISKNVIWVSRVKAVEMFERCWQRG